MIGIVERACDFILLILISKLLPVLLSQCPLYLSDYQRRAMIFAARTVGLNVLRLINDTTSVALAYGIYKQVGDEVNDLLILAEN